MTHRIAKIVSFVFHPVVLILLLPLLVISHYSKNFLYGLEWMLFSSIFVFLFLVVFFFLQPVQFLTDFDISKKEKRPVFYTIVLLFAIVYFIVAVLFKGIFFPLSVIALGIILGTVLFELANFYLKVSVHGAVATAYVITLGVIYGFVPFLVFCWIPLVVGWSRVSLKRHTKQEFIAGALLGAIVTLLTFAIGEILV